MRRTSGSFLASAAALVLGCGLVGTAYLIAQDAANGGAGSPDGSAAQASQKPKAPQPAPTPQAAAPASEAATAPVTGAGGRNEPAQPAPKGHGASKTRTSSAGKTARSRHAGRGHVALQAGSTAPPTNLKLVGDHWTPYDPPDPESFPKDATLHVIVPGDTLWGLADLAFGNPYLWPQIWNQNKYILDSHWIYPGDPLLVPPRPTVVTEVVPQGQEGAPPAAPEAEAPETPEEPLTAEAPAAPAPGVRPPAGAHAPRNVPKLTPLAGESDIRCSGFIAPKDEQPDYFIANQEDENKVGLTEGDMIYINRGRENGHTETGTEYSVVVREGEVRHPVTGRLLGIYYKRLGSVKVVAAQDRTAMGVISMACDDIRTGYDLVPLLVTPQPARPAPPFSRLQTIDEEGKPTGYIVHTLDNSERVGTGWIVDIDLGFDDGLKAGDYLTIYIPNEPYDKYRKITYDYQWRNRRFETPPSRRDEKNVYPPKIIGQIVVLTTERHTATAKIINAVREIEVGNQVILQ
jgi:nucleoid-associated protein YgaU